MKKYITWKEPVYLLYLPVLVRSESCCECGRSVLQWEKKGFIKIKDIKHKRERTFMDDVNEITYNRYQKNLEFYLGEPSILNKINKSK